MNLLSNAAKFCADRAAGSRSRSASLPGAIRVDVRDDGPGIAREDQERIFEKFRQAGDTLTAKPSGDGARARDQP